ncbi:hypothetical protein S40288_09751 [Stachybotrys chartarum IBT 40288]|nr:hypothetical protein S40288_09751 [Stachybotrys chartarum IBT 40288]
MADPLSIAASVVGVTIPTLEGMRLLLDILSEIKDAPKTIKRLSDDIRSVDATLDMLRGVGEREWLLLGTTAAEQSRTTITGSKEACDHFRAKLQRWTKHSDDGRLTWQDRASVGIFKKAQIKAMSEQLQNCKLSINTVISIATLYSSVRNSHLTEEIKGSICVKQDEINRAITATDRQLVVLQGRLEELEISSDEEEGSMSPQDRAEVQQQLMVECDALDASRILLQELLAKSQEESVQKAALGSQVGSTTISFGQQNSGFQAGIIHGNVSGQTFGGK